MVAVNVISRLNMLLPVYGLREHIVRAGQWNTDPFAAVWPYAEAYQSRSCAMEASTYGGQDERRSTNYAVNKQLHLSDYRWSSGTSQCPRNQARDTTSSYQKVRSTQLSQ